MAQFTVNANRADPYKSFKFRVKWDGRLVAGVSRISPLRRVTDVVEHRDGGAPSLARKSPGRTAYDAITLERGRTHDTEFEAWANRVSKLAALPGAEMALGDFRKDIVIEFLNEAGQLALAFIVHRCWPSQYVAFASLDANGDGGVAIESITLEHEGWERDTSVAEPLEPTSS